MAAVETFEDVRREMMRLYTDKQYAECDALLSRKQDHFPEKAHRIYFWRLCLITLQGNIDEALNLFERALDRGHWQDETTLHNDEDLKALQGNPRFEALVLRNAVSQKAAQAAATPYREDYPPETKPPFPLLIGLHGNASSVADQGGYWKQAAESGWLVAAPQSTQVSGPDMYVWNDLAWSKREVCEHVEAVRNHYTIDTARTIVGGFSMGGQVAPWLVLNGTIPAKGFICVVPYIPEEVLTSWLPDIDTAAERGIKGFIIAGEADTPCLPGAYALQDAMRLAGAACELRVYPDMGHVYPPDWETVLPEAIKFIES